MTQHDIGMNKRVIVAPVANVGQKTYIPANAAPTRAPRRLSRITTQKYFFISPFITDGKLSNMENTALAVAPVAAPNPILYIAGLDLNSL